jgi:hypothetical protein
MGDRADLRHNRAGSDSHAAAQKASPKNAFLAAQGKEQQKPLDECPAIPLHLKPVLNGYAEVAALGICSERALRRHLATGRVKRCVIRNGRNLRFVKDLLIAELLEAGE